MVVVVVVVVVVKRRHGANGPFFHIIASFHCESNDF